MARPMIKVGTYTGTGAAQNIELGFVPTYVRILNITDGNAGMTYMKPEGEDAKNIAEGAALATQAANGISVYGGAAPGTALGKSAGFTAGTAASVNTKVYYYVALRGE